MGETHQHATFRTLANGAREVLKTSQAAFSAWTDDDTEACSEHLRQLEEDCETLLRQARGARADFEASVGT